MSKKSKQLSLANMVALREQTWGHGVALVWMVDHHASHCIQCPVPVACKSPPTVREMWRRFRGTVTIVCDYRTAGKLPHGGCDSVALKIEIRSLAVS